MTPQFLFFHDKQLNEHHFNKKNPFFLPHNHDNQMQKQTPQNIYKAKTKKITFLDQVCELCIRQKLNKINPIWHHNSCFSKTNNWMNTTLTKKSFLFTPQPWQPNARANPTKYLQGINKKDHIFTPIQSCYSVCELCEEKGYDTYAMGDWNQCSTQGPAAGPWEGE